MSAPAEREFTAHEDMQDRQVMKKPVSVTYNAEAMVQLRCPSAGGDWDRFWGLDEPWQDARRVRIWEEAQGPG